MTSRDCGWGHTGPCKDGCDCDTAKTVKRLSATSSTDALAAALTTVTGSVEATGWPNSEVAAAILAALPGDAHVFTVDSLAARLCAHYCDPSPLWADCLADEHYRDAATAIIQAAKEAERE